MPTKVSTLPAVMLLLAGCLSVLPGPCAGEARAETEPNNAFDNATMLALGDTCTGSVGFGADDVDFFGFNVTKQTLLTVTVTVTATRDGGLASVDNASRKTVGTGFGIAAGKSWTWQKNVGNDSGTWYLSVRGGGTNYTVNLQGTVPTDLPLSVEITGPANGSLATDPYLDVTGTVTGGNGSREVWVYMVGDPPSKWVRADGTEAWTAEVFIAAHPGYENYVNITARASDGAGHLAYATITIHMNFRTNSGPGAPQVNITEPADGTVFLNREQITVRGTAYHPSGILGIDCWINPGNGSTAYINTLDGYRNWSTVVRLLPGESTINVVVWANDENFSRAYTRVRLNTTTLINDTVPPTVKITSPYDGAWITQDDDEVMFKGTASDDHRVVYVKIQIGIRQPAYVYPANETKWFSWSKKVHLNIGQNVVNVTAYDYSNNSASTNITVNFKWTSRPFIPGAGAPALAAAIIFGFALVARRRK